MKATLTLLATLTLIVGCSSSEPAAAPKATPVRVSEAGTGPATPAISANGLVASRDEMRLSFKVGGIIRRIAVSQGQEVRKGQLLAEIELGEVGAQVEQARQSAEKASRDLERGERRERDPGVGVGDPLEHAAWPRANVSADCIIAPASGARRCMAMRASTTGRA